jgi:hypothetical protein
MRTKKVVSACLAATLFTLGATLPIEAYATNYEGIFKGTFQYTDNVPEYDLTGAGTTPFTFEFVFSDPADSTASELYGGLPDPVRSATLTVNGISHSLPSDFNVDIRKGILPGSTGPYAYFIFEGSDPTGTEFGMNVFQINTLFGGTALNDPFSAVAPFDDWLGYVSDGRLNYFNDVFYALSFDSVSVAAVGDPVPPPAPPIYWCYDPPNIYCSSPPSFGPNLLAAPEPTGWALMIAGFGLTGAMLRRPRRACIPRELR